MDRPAHSTDRHAPFAKTALWLMETARLATRNSREQIARPLLDQKRRRALQHLLGSTGEEAKLARTTVGERVRLDFAVYAVSLDLDPDCDPGILSATIQIAASSRLEEAYGDLEKARTALIAMLAPLVDEPDAERTEEEILAGQLQRRSGVNRSRRALAAGGLAASG